MRGPYPSARRSNRPAGTWVRQRKGIPEHLRPASPYSLVHPLYCPCAGGIPDSKPFAVVPARTPKTPSTNVLVPRYFVLANCHDAFLPTVMSATAPVPSQHPSSSCKTVRKSSSDFPAQSPFHYPKTSPSPQPDSIHLSVSPVTRVSPGYPLQREPQLRSPPGSQKFAESLPEIPRSLSRYRNPVSPKFS